MRRAVVRAELEAAVRLGKPSVAVALAVFATHTAARAVLGAGQELAREPTEALGAGAATVIACAVPTAVVGTALNGAVSADPRVFAHTGEVHAETVLVAIVLAPLLRAGDTLPAFVADARAVAAVSVLGALVRALHFIAGDALPVGVARALGPARLLVLLASAVDARVASRVGAVFASPEGGAGALAVLACPVSRAR